VRGRDPAAGRRAGPPAGHLGQTGSRTARSRPADQGKPAVADRRPGEGVVGELGDRDPLEEVGGQERQRRRLEEAAHGVAEDEADGVGVLRGDLHLGPRPGERTGVLRVLEDVDRVDDVRARHRDTIVPRGVVAEMERPRRPLVRDRPAIGQVGQHGGAGPKADEPPEEESDEVAIDLVRA